MRICVLDGDKITDKEKLYDALKSDLILPDWYGRNLDALYDCLTDGQEEVRILIKNQALLECHLGRYAILLLQVLHRISEDNPDVHIMHKK